MHVIHFENIKNCMHEMALALNVLIMKRLRGSFFPFFVTFKLQITLIKARVENIHTASG